MCLELSVVQSSFFRVCYPPVEFPIKENIKIHQVLISIDLNRSRCFHAKSESGLLHFTLINFYFPLAGPVYDHVGKFL